MPQRGDSARHLAGHTGQEQHPLLMGGQGVGLGPQHRAVGQPEHSGTAAQHLHGTAAARPQHRTHTVTRRTAPGCATVGSLRVGMVRFCRGAQWHCAAGRWRCAVGRCRGELTVTPRRAAVTAACRPRGRVLVLLSVPRPRPPPRSSLLIGSGRGEGKSSTASHWTHRASRVKGARRLVRGWHQL